jgi:hypothetical protein
MLDPSFLKKIGVWQDPDGAYKRYRLRTKNVEYDPTDDKAVLRGNIIGYDLEEVPYPVLLPLATDPDSIAEAHAKAVARRADFYHPKWGWLRWGVKREQEHTENLGAGAIQYSHRHVRLKDPGTQVPAPPATEEPNPELPGIPEEPAPDLPGIPEEPSPARPEPSPRVKAKEAQS